MDHGVSRDFEGDQDEGYHGENDLQTFGALLFRGEVAAAPLRGGTCSQAPDPGEDGEVDQGAGGSQGKHGYTDGVLVEAAGRGVDAARGGKGGQPDGDTNAAHGKDGRAEALPHGDHETDAAQGLQSSVILAFRRAGQIHLGMMQGSQNQSSAAGRQSVLAAGTYLGV